MLNREAIILNYSAGAAWKFRDVFGVGATVRVDPRAAAGLLAGDRRDAVRRRSQPGVEPDLDMLASTRGSDPFTFNAILGAWFRPVPFAVRRRGAGGAREHRDQQHALGDAARHPDRGPGRADPRRHPANDVSVTLPLPLLARVGARYRDLAGTGASASTSSWTSNTRPGRACNEFAVDTHDLVANFQGSDVDLDRIEIAKRWRDTVAVKLGGDVAVIPDRLALRAGAFYETAVADAAYANVDFAGGPMFGGSAGVSLAFGRWEIALAYQLRQQTASASPRRTRASTSRCRPAPASRRTPTRTVATRTTWGSRRRPSTPAPTTRRRTIFRWRCCTGTDRDPDCAVRGISTSKEPPCDVLEPDGPRRAPRRSPP